MNKTMQVMSMEEGANSLLDEIASMRDELDYIYSLLDEKDRIIEMYKKKCYDLKYENSMLKEKRHE